MADVRGRCLVGPSPSRSTPFINISDIAAEEAGDVSTGETSDTLCEHRNALKKEMAKPKNRNLMQIKELMEITFKDRRKCIERSPTTLHLLLQQYPALKLVTEV